MASSKYVWSCLSQPQCLINRQRILEQMKLTLLEKAEVEEKLTESEYTRANYRRDFESSQHELALLKNSAVRQTTTVNRSHGAVLINACLGAKFICLGVG